MKYLINIVKIFIILLLSSTSLCFAQSYKQTVVDKWDYVGISQDFLDKEKIYIDMRTIKKDEKNNYYTCKVKIIPINRDDGTYFVRNYAISTSGLFSMHEILSEQNCYFGRLAPMSEMKSPDKIVWKHNLQPNTGWVIWMKILDFTKK